MEYVFFVDHFMLFVTWIIFVVSPVVLLIVLYVLCASVGGSAEDYQKNAVKRDKIGENDS